MTFCASTTIKAKKISNNQRPIISPYIDANEHFVPAKHRHCFNHTRVLQLVACMLCLMGFGLVARAADKPMIPALIHQPGFATAINVKTDVTPAAKGDGVADDTAALQAAFTQLGAKGSTSKTVYLPKGTYRITKSLNIGEVRLVGGAIIGDGRDSRIIWDGESGQPMINSLGFTHSSFIGFVLDGKNKANAGVLHIAKIFETDMLYRDMAFMNIKGTGVSIGTPHKGPQTAEVLYDNCLFDHCDVGVSFIKFNDYNHTFNGCEFRDCGTGILNLHGNMYVRNTHFLRSTVTDIRTHGEHGSSIRRCTSLNSKRFVVASDKVSTLIVQDCHIQGWDDFAINSSNSLLMFDCTFTPAKTGAATTPLKGWRNALILSNNKVLGDGKLTLQKPAGNNKRYDIPDGKLGGSLTSANQTFLLTSRSMPTKIFNAKTDFGAKSNSKTDDTQAIQNTIDAARAYGKDAIAYLPAGKYYVTQTLNLHGANYRFGGDGGSTIIEWNGADGGTILHVTDPQNLIVENIYVGRSTRTNNDNDILQTSTNKGPTSIIYHRIFVYSPYYNPRKKTNPPQELRRRGVHLQKLGKQDTVLITMMRGNLHIDDSAAATILCNASFNAGAITVEGTSKDRSGFFGILTKLGVGEMPTLLVKNSHSAVIGDLYAEQGMSVLKLTGSPDDAPGRVTVQGSKFQIDAASTVPAVEIDGYRGVLTLGPDQFYPQDNQPRFIARSTTAMDFVLLGNYIYKNAPAMKLGLNITLHNLGNVGRGSPYSDHIADFADTNFETAAQKVADALDHLRRLGQLDLEFNHPQVFKEASAD